MLGIVVSRADDASVAIGEALRNCEDWRSITDESRPEATGGGSVYRTDGARLREFDARHLDLDRPAAVFDPDLDLLVFASKHAGDTGRLLTAHHTGNFGPADHGGKPNALARACPNAHAHVLEAMDRHAPEGYDVGTECTHHGPTDVGVPSMFVEVGSGPEEWADPAAAEAVARAILALRDVTPDRQAAVEGDPGTRRHLVGFGGGHYAPRFERIARETDWTVGHVAADWGLAAMPDPASEAGRELIASAFTTSAAAYGVVAGDRPALREAITALGYRVVSETWARETDDVPLDLVDRLESDVEPVDDGLRFGPVASEDPDDVVVRSLPDDLLDTAYGIDQATTRAAVQEVAVAYATDEGGTRPAATVALADETDREAILDGLVDVLCDRYDAVDQNGDELVARETVFDPERAETLGVPEGPAFGRLAAGEAVDVDGRTIPPEKVTSTRVDRFTVR